MAQRSNKPQASALEQRREFAGANCGEIAGDRAPHFFGRSDLNCHGFSGRWVAIVQLGAGQVQSCAGVQGRGAIHEVAHHGVPHGCGMAPDLMGASCLDGPFHQRGAAVHSPASGAQHAERRTAWFAVDGKSASACGRKVMPTAPAVVRFHNGRPLGLEGGHGSRIPCHEHRSAGSMVQPMHGLGSWRKRFGACQECT